MAFSRATIVLGLSLILAGNGLRVHEDAEVYSWWCEDNLICYQGPKDAMADMMDRALKGPTGKMYTSGLQKGTCTEHGFPLDFPGQTCFGKTYASKKDVMGHMVAEAVTAGEFVKKYGNSAVKNPGCASCQGHC
mmetsp:Transcript_9232/g.20938  ORF Transcript_9232/g.20938 Transcript_9232/m.20938 type:complete len:134 (-) Transcript_9232:60-461(-)